MVLTLVSWNGMRAGEPVVTRCVEVLDGDTFTVKIGEKVYEVDIRAIDAPEAGQEFGNECREFLGSLVLNREVHLEDVSGTDGKRFTARVLVDEQDVAEVLIQNGMAWHDLRHDSREELILEQIKARTAGRGLWAQENPVPPWQWRASHEEKEGPAPRTKKRLSQVASSYSLEKNQGGRTVIHQPPPSKKRSKASGKNEDSGSDDSILSPFGGSKCCCELTYVTLDDDVSAPGTVHKMIDKYACENAVTIIDFKENIEMTPVGCVGDYLCE